VYMSSKHRANYFKPTGRGNYVDESQIPEGPVVWDVSSRDKMEDVRQGVKTVAQLRQALEVLVQPIAPPEEIKPTKNEVADVNVEVEVVKVIPTPQPTIHDWLHDLEESLNELLRSAKLSDDYLRLISMQVNEKLDMIKELADLFTAGIELVKEDETYKTLVSILDWIDEQKILWSKLTQEEEEKNSLGPSPESVVNAALDELKNILRQNLADQNKFVELLTELISAILASSLSGTGKVDMFWAKYVSENESLPNVELLPALVEDQVAILVNAYIMKDTSDLTQRILQDEQSFLDAVMASSFVD